MSQTADPQPGQSTPADRHLNNESAPNLSVSGRRRRWAELGPGLVLAAASIGAADMVTSINGAAQFGMGLLWAAAFGILVKFVLTEAVGRHHLATGRTIVADLGATARPAAVVLLAVFALIALLYGAGLSSVAALAVTTLVPSLPLVPVAIVASVAAAAVVVVGRYTTFERVMKWFVVLKFVLMVVLAVLALTTVKDWGAFFATFTPRMPSGAVLDVVAIIGGVGGTAGVIAYGYWVREKGWNGPERVRTIRVDSGVSYAMIFLFVVATSILGTVLVYGSGLSIRGTAGLAALGDPLRANIGAAARVLFLVAFALVAFSALVGGFNGLAHLLGDSWTTVRGRSADQAGGSARTFRVLVLAMLVASIVIVFTGRPVTLLLAYATAGSLVLPVLAAFLLWRMNRRDIIGPLRNGWASNAVHVLALIMFVALAIVQVRGLFA